MAYTRKTQRAIDAYGQDVCIEAFRKHDQDGEGGSTVGFYLGLKTNQADAAINAGREIVERAALRVTYYTEAGPQETVVSGFDHLAALSKSRHDCYAPPASELRAKLAVEHLKRVAPGFNAFHIHSA